MKLEFRQTVTCNHLTLAMVCKTIDWQQPLPRCGEYVAGLDTLDGEPELPVRKLLHIAGDDKPAEVVRSRFMKLNADHIRFVLKCLAENGSPIRNMKQYLLASLYNAPTTMQLSYQNQTNHDLAIRG